MSFNNELGAKETSYMLKDEINTKQLTVQIKNHDNGLFFIFVPFAVLLTIMLLSAMVYLMARNRRRFYSMYNRDRVTRNRLFDASELEDDNDDPTKSLLSGRLEIKTSVNVYKTYQKRTCNENSEFYM